MNNKIYRRERRFLQISILLAASVPVIAGGAGMIFGTAMLSRIANISLDSHLRYLSGLLFAIGISFWTIVPSIETKTSLTQLLTFIVVMGGFARLAGAIFMGPPSKTMLYAISMELIITPLFCWWQSRIARLHFAGRNDAGIG